MKLKIEVSPGSISVSDRSGRNKAANIEVSEATGRKCWHVWRDADGSEVFQSEGAARVRARQLYGYSKIGSFEQQSTAFTVWGVDWGLGIDKTVVAVNTNGDLSYHYLSPSNGHDLEGLIENLFIELKPSVVVIESNSIDSVTYNSLVTRGLPVVRFAVSRFTMDMLNEFISRYTGGAFITDEDRIAASLALYAQNVFIKKL